MRKKKQARPLQRLELDNDFSSRMDDEATWGFDDRRRGEELWKASERIGFSPQKAMKWLLNFLQADIPTLSMGEWLDLRHEIVVFAILDAKAFKPSNPLSSSEGRHLRMIFGSLWLEKDFLRKAPNLKIAHNLQNYLKSKIQEFLSNGSVSLSLEGMTLKLQKGTKALTDPNPPTVYVEYQSKDYKTPFTHALGELLRDTGGRLAQCLECQTIFLADRRDQKFCSVKCQNRVAARQYRASQEKPKGKPGRPLKTNSKGQKKSQQKKTSSLPNASKKK